MDDFPLIVQDKVVNADGTLSEQRLDDSVFFLGNRILVNGTLDPHLRISSQRARLRILNASNSRLLHFGFADGRTLGRDAIGKGDFDLLKIIAADRLSASPPVPDRLATTPPIEVPAGARVRRFQLDGDDEINGRDYAMDRIDEVVPAGAHEIWEVEARDHAHNFHIHEVALRVIGIGGRQPPAWYRSQKDTVFLPATSKTRLAVQFGHFTDPTTPYMYHCHILRHEDRGMMGQFVIVQPRTEEDVVRTLPTADTGHAHG
ncbi:multicopper oxidase family protein [Streptomyces sp. NPDC058157]|uniref:multicopper oxidase family protein n=1 Tax=Streptomyces sp. NPDC058157 TaxID=3346360 RepID=UPI0036F0D8B9